MRKRVHCWSIYIISLCWQHSPFPPVEPYLRCYTCAAVWKLITPILEKWKTIMINNSVAISQQQHAGQQQQPVAGPHHHHDQERGGSAHGSRSSSHYSPQWSHVYVLNLEYHETMYITTSKMSSYFTYLDHPCWKYNRWNDSKKSSFFTICNVDCAVILRETPFFDLRHPEQRNNTNTIINFTNNCNNFCIQSCAWDQRRGLAEKYCIARRFNGLFSLLSSEASSADPPLSSAV